MKSIIGGTTVYARSDWPHHGSFKGCIFFFKFWIDQGYVFLQYAPSQHLIKNKNMSHSSEISLEWEQKCKGWEKEGT